MNAATKAGSRPEPGRDDRGGVLVARLGARALCYDLTMRLSPILLHQPSAFLLAAQLLSLVLYPIMDDSSSGRALFGAVGMVVVSLALWVVNRSPAVNWIAWRLAVPAVGLTVIALERSDLLVFSSVFESGLYSYAAGGLIIYMLRDHKVTGDELFAAGATFTQLAWGQLDGIAVPELHHAVGRRHRRHPADQRAGARPGDAGAVRRGRLHHRHRLAPDQPDHRAQPPRGKLTCNEWTSCSNANSSN